MQFARIIFLIDILTKYTDEDHLLNSTQIIDKLKAYGIEAERKTVYSDINALIDSGTLDIEQVGGRYGGVHVLSRKFELPELKMLVDAVQASKFITKKQCASLIKKISEFSSVYDEKKLSRSVYIYDRATEHSKNAYYMIDSIHTAISENRSILFQYTEMTPKKERYKRHKGEFYAVSPYALLWRDENYYLVAFHHDSQTIRHYRVDKMENVIISDSAREGTEVFDNAALAKYSSNVFEMFGGDEYVVHFRCDNALAGAMFDRFGTELQTYDHGDYFEFYAPVQISVRFFGWVFGFDGGLQILSPQSVVDDYKKQLEKVRNSI
ncbi:MAG: WYL domain-containing protein [Clostridia bacterium]|nr:WYL domain-containing protein [Clostridia bacterium]